MLTNEDISLDRLVDGELGPDERRALIERLDSQPDGWRRCALAFLEAQTFQEALGELVAYAASDAPFARAPRRSTFRRLALAAVLLTAFGAGWWSRPRPEAIPIERLMVAAPEVVPASHADEHPAALERSPEVAEDPPAPQSAESLIQTWQRRGFHVEREERLVSVDMPTGGRRTVPVQEVRLQYIGDRTF